MNRSKKKHLHDAEILSNASDDDMPDDVHRRFIENVKQSRGKPKIDPASRNESSAQVSEFNIPSTKEAKKSTFREADLLQVIQTKKPKVAQKLHTVKKAKTLSRPLESVHEKKIQREVGFENVKKRLDRWKDVVQNNRLADQLSFPLQNNTMEIFDHTDAELFSTFTEPTPFEKEFAEVLKRSDVAKEEEEKVRHSKFRITLREMIERRKLWAKTKARASYEVVKARRQNKIKSKKYHRILRQERTKKQSKEFEELEKNDPEAALKQLESLEKNRAEERATLRHRNSGKWARNQLIKAKYNKESRIALSEQLNKNRELTQKRAESSSDDESSHTSDAELKRDASIDPTGGSYAQFVSNYKKFWEEKIVKDVKSENKTKKPVEKAIESSSTISKSSKTNTKCETRAATSQSLRNTFEGKNSTAEVMSSSGLWTVTETLRTNDAKAEPKVNDARQDGKTSKSMKISKNIKKIEKKKAKKCRNKRKSDERQKLLVVSGTLSSSEAAPFTTENPKIVEPKEVVELKELDSNMPDILGDGGETIDDDNQQVRMLLDEAYVDNDIETEFKQEKENAIESSMPQVEDTSLPGWGSWAGPAELEKRQTPKAKCPRLNKRLLFKLPKAPPRKDSNKGHVIINEDKSNKLKEHLVSELPHPFTQVKDYEASIRTPVGRTWLPETAHQKLIAPPVLTKLGTVIEPIDEGELIRRDE